MYVWTSIKKHLLFAAVCMLLGALGSSTASAQARWLQRLEVITPVENEYVTGALLDSLATVFPGSTGTYRRAPDAETEYSYEELQEVLLDEGLDLTSATHMFVGYRLEANRIQFSTDITYVHFIYRPEDGDGLDSPILYLDGKDPLLLSVINKSGTQLKNNEAAMVLFKDQLAFHLLPESQIVRLGDDVIREEAEAEANKTQLLATIQRFLNHY